MAHRRRRRLACFACLLQLACATAPAPDIPVGLLMSTGLGTNATSGSALPYLKVPTSLYASGSCGVFATPVVALASGVSTIFTLYAALDVLGNNFKGMLLAVYPDAGGAPGSPPLFDGLLSASMCWQQSGGGDNASAYGFAPSSTHWPNTGVVSCNITGGVGLFGQALPVQYSPSGYAAPAGLWNAHHGRSGFALVAGATYWVALSSVTDNSAMYVMQADPAVTSGAPQTATLMPADSCPSFGLQNNRDFATYPSTGALSWSPALFAGTGLAINFCSSAAQPVTAAGGGTCMGMPSAAGRRRLAAAAAAAARAGAVASAARRTTAKVPARSLALLPAPTFILAAPVLGLVASTGLSWGAPASLPNMSFLASCKLVASPVLTTAAATIGFIAASVAVTSPLAPWNGWQFTRGAPYVPGLLFGVYADAAGAPGALLWSALFAWDELAPVVPARTPGTAFWRPWNTFSVNLTNATRLPPLLLAANTTYWLALGGSGNRNDSTAGSAWDFMQGSVAALPAGYAAQAAVVSAGTPCGVGAFPPAANGSLAWASMPPAGTSAMAGPAISLCDATSTTACTALQLPPSVRVLPTDSAPPGTSLASTGVNAAPSTGGAYGSLNAIELPARYFSSSCTLLAAPIYVTATGIASTVQLSVSTMSSQKLRAGIILGIYADAGGAPGVPLFLGWVTASALQPVELPRSTLADLDDWRVYNTAVVNISGADNFQATNDNANGQGSILLYAGSSAPAVIAGEVAWVVLGAAGTVSGANGVSDSSIAFQEAMPFSLSSGYSVMNATVSATQGCSGNAFLGADSAGALVWQPDTSVTANGFALFINSNSPPPPVTPTTSASASASSSTSTSQTATASGSASATLSRSTSGSLSQSPTATLSTSGSSSATAAGSPSTSQTPSWSSTLTAAQSPTISPTQSASPSATSSATATPSASPSPSATSSASPSPSWSSTLTAAQSSTISATQSASPTGSATNSLTATPSATPTPSATASASPSPSATPSASPSPSAMASASLSQSATASPSPSPSLSLVPWSSVVLTVSVSVLSPAGVVSTACSAAAQAAVAATVVGTAANVTTANGGATSCSILRPGRRRLARSAAVAAAANCSTTTSAPVYVLYVVPVIVPPAGSAGTALIAINALSASDYAALLASLSSGSGCPTDSFNYAATTTSAACGSTSSGSPSCQLPGGGSAAPNVGAIIGGVLGGAAVLAFFVALVLAARGHCACCGPRCPRHWPTPGGGADGSASARKAAEREYY